MLWFLMYTRADNPNYVGYWAHFNNLKEAEKDAEDLMNRRMMNVSVARTFIVHAISLTAARYAVGKTLKSEQP